MATDSYADILAGFLEAKRSASRVKNHPELLPPLKGSHTKLYCEIMTSCTHLIDEARYLYRRDKIIPCQRRVDKVDHVS